MSFRDWYRSQFSKTLSEPLAESDGIAEADIEHLLDGRRIPLALYDYYCVAGWHWMNTNYDRLLQPNELREADSHTIFMDENQNAGHWAFKNDGVRSTIRQFISAKSKVGNSSGTINWSC